MPKPTEDLRAEGIEIAKTGVDLTYEEKLADLDSEMSPRVVYDELGPNEYDVEWVDDDGDRWRFDTDRRHWQWLSDDGWALAVPMSCYGPFTERPVIGSERTK